MRTPSISSNFYSPAPVPDDAKKLKEYLEKELTVIAGVLSLISAGHIDKTYAAPTKPREGDIRFADGTTWNPGAGIGIYAYYSAGWHFLG